MKNLINQHRKWYKIVLVMLTISIGKVWGADIVIDLDLAESSTYPSDFPTTTGTKTGTHTLGGYSFSFSCNTGYYKGSSNNYLMIGACSTTEATASIITFPAIADYKLSKVELTTTSSGSTALSLYIGTGFSTVTAGGTAWTYEQSKTKTWTLTATSANTAYKLYIKRSGSSGTKNCQIAGLKLTYAATTSSCTTNPTLNEAENNGSISASSIPVKCTGITSVGTGCSLTSYGFVYGTSANPTTSNSTIEIGTSIATATTFSTTISGLSASTTYYIRPYATNGNGTGYGSQYTVTTSAAATPHTITFICGTNNTFVAGSSGANGGGTATGSVSTSSLTNLPSATPCSHAADDGWSFDGWSASSVSDNSSSYTKITAPYNPTSDVSLYAVYKKGGNTMSSTTLTQVTGTVPTTGQYIAMTCIADAASVISNTTTTNYSGLIKVNPGDNSSYASSSLTTTNATTIYKLESAGTSGGYTYYYLKNVVSGKYLAATSNDKELIFVDATSDAAAWRFKAASTVWYLCNKSYETGWFYYDSTNKYWECRRSASNPSTGNYQVYMYTIAPANVSISAIYQSTLDCTETYHVYYDANGADGGSVPVDNTEYNTSGSATVLGNTGSLTRNGYTWSCWNTNAAGTGTDKSAENTVTIGSTDVYLYAKWTVNNHSVSVSSVGNVTIKATPSGGSDIAEGSNANVNYGTTVTLNYSSLTANYSFTAWDVYKTGESSTKVTLSSTTANNATFTMPDYDVTVTATVAAPWKYFTNCSSALNVTYNANGATSGTVPTDNTDYTSGSTVTVKDNTGSLARTGYTFGGWNTQADGTGTNYTAGTGTFTISSNTRLYAKWTPISYTVHFNKNNTSATGTMSNQSFAYGEEKALTANGFSLSGKTFIGWATSDDGSKVYNNSQSVSNLSSTNDAIVDLYAVWADMYVVSYSVPTSDNTAPTAHDPITPGSSVTLKSYTTSLTCAKFIGWTDATTYKHGTSTLYTAGSTFTPSATTTLKAVYGMMGDSYELVTSVGDLSIGSQVVIASRDLIPSGNYTYHTMSEKQNSNNRSVFDITSQDGTTMSWSAEDDDAEEFTLEAGTVSDTYSFYSPTSNGYLAAASSSSNYLHTDATKTDNSSFEISISDSVATITAKGTYTHKILRYNSSNDVYACYESGQTNPSIFQKSISSYTTTPSCVSYTVTLAVSGNASGSAKIGSNATAATTSTSQSVSVSGAGSVKIKNITDIAGYNYAVTQTAGEDATLTNNGDGTYTISGLTSDATFTVTYSAKPTCNITFDVGTAGTGTYTELTAYNGQTVTIPATYTPTSSCGTFVGWAPGTKANGTRPTTIITAGSSYTHSTDGDITMYAVYSFTSGCTPEFAAGRSGNYEIYCEDGSETKYYVTIPTSYSAENTISFRVNNESSEYYNPATLTLSYNSGSSTYCILFDDLYLALNSSASLMLSETPFFWTLNNNTCGYYFTGTSSGTTQILGISNSSDGVPYRFTSFSSSNVPDDCTASGSLISSFALNFEVADEVEYYTDYTCGSTTVDVTFAWDGSMTWSTNPSWDAASDYTGLAKCTELTEYPTASYDGWTFIGWTTTEYNDTYSDYLDDEYNSYTAAPSTTGIYTTAGNHLTLSTADVTLYPVFTKYPNNEYFSLDDGGDYYIYFYYNTAFFQDDFYASDSHLTRMYATEYPNSGGKMSYTPSCASAQLFEFRKRADGYWNIRLKNADGTYPSKSYVTNTSGNDFAKAVAAAPSYGWAITAGSGGSYIISYRGNPGNWSGGSISSGTWQTYYKIKAQINGSSMNFKCYNQDTEGSNYYMQVYLGSCAERLFSSNPATTPHVFISGDIKVTATAGQSVKAASTLTVSAYNISTSNVTITSNNSNFKFSTSATATAASFTSSVNVSVVSKRVSETPIYVLYTPTATDDGIESATITVSDGAGTPTTASTNSGDVQGRHLPANFVIVAKADGKWLALPSVMSGVTPHDGDIVFVDNIDDPTKVTYAMKSDIWHLRQVASGDRYTAHGEAVTFVNGTGATTDKALFATTSSSGTGIGFDAQYANYNNTNPAQYEWLLTSEDLETYNVATNLGSQTNKTLTYKTSTQKWGLYGSGDASITDIRLLPIENEMDDLGYSVIEWRAQSSNPYFAVAGLTSSSLTKLPYKILENAAQSTISSIGEASCTVVTGDIAKVTSISGYGAGKLLVFFDKKTTPTKMSIIELPVIISGTTALSSSTHGGKDIVVAKDGTLNINTAGTTIKNLTVMGGGKVVMNANTTTKGKVTMRGGYSYIDDSFTMPQLYIASSITFSGSTDISFDYVIDNTFYYWIAVPYEVNFANVTDEADSTNFKSWVQYYDGEQRASGDQVTGWKKIMDTKFEVGKGYTVAAKVRQNDANELVKDRKYAYIHFPLKNNNTLLSHDTYGELSTTKSVAVTAPGFTGGVKNSELKDNNVGWNLLGNPFVTKYKLADESGTFAVGNLVKTMNGSVWTGDYHWENTSYRYVTLPKTLNSDEYEQKKVSDAVIDAFFPFFIQVKSAGTLTFANSGTTNRQNMPAYKMAQSKVREVSVDLNLDSDSDTDNMGLLIGDNFTDGYDFGDDLVKMMNYTQLAVYTISGNQNLAFNALSERSALLPIPIGYRAPTEGTYLFRLNENIDLSEIESVTLIDYAEGISTELLYNDYEFNTKAGNNTSRFAISVTLRAPQIYTDIDIDKESGALDNLLVSGSEGQLTLVGLPAGAEVYVYDMTGKMAAHRTADEQRLHIDVPHGIYNVRVLSDEGNATVKAIVR